MLTLETNYLGQMFTFHAQRVDTMIHMHYAKPKRTKTWHK